MPTSTRIRVSKAQMIRLFEARSLHCVDEKVNDDLVSRRRCKEYGKGGKIGRWIQTKMAENESSRKERSASSGDFVLLQMLDQEEWTKKLGQGCLGSGTGA